MELATTLEYQVAKWLLQKVNFILWLTFIVFFLDKSMLKCNLEQAVVHLNGSLRHFTDLKIYVKTRLALQFYFAAS